MGDGSHMGQTVIVAGLDDLQGGSVVMDELYGGEGQTNLLGSGSAT